MIRNELNFKYIPNDTFVDEQEVRDRWWHPSKEEVVLDVGAAFGSYTLPAAAAGAVVYAFSPDPIDTELLGRNVDLNEFGGRVHILPYGLYSCSGYIDTYDFAKTPRFSNIPTYNLKCYSVKALDEAMILERVPKVDWIKLDVEGAEHHVLLGAVHTIKKYRPFILIENHIFMDPLLEGRVSEFMHTMSYTGETVPYGSISHTLWRG